MRITVDFETRAIEPRPAYPPVPVGVALKLGSRRSEYHAWGHPEANTTTRAAAQRLLVELWREARAGRASLLFHNAKFDLDVAETHLGLARPPAERIDDTLLLAFLVDPNAQVLSLKPLAELWLGKPPTEQAALRDWIVTYVPAARRAKARWGAWISEAPGALVAPYARGDVDRTAALYRALAPRVTTDRGLVEAYARERRLLGLTLELERAGVPIATRALADALPGWERDLALVDAWLRRRLRARALDLDAPDELADALEAAELVREWLLTEKTGRRSVAIDDLREVVEAPEVVETLAYRARLANAIRTFARPWLERARSNADAVPVEWHAVRSASERAAGRALGARTGRFSSTPNLQNVPQELSVATLPRPLARRLGAPPRLRDYVRGAAGEVVLVRDYSQQEFRLLAHYAGGALADAYRADPRLDLHEHARVMINARLGTAYARKPIKNLGFGILYGMGLDRLGASVGVERGTAAALRVAYRAIAPGLARLDAELRARAARAEPIRTLGGRLYLVEPPRVIRGAHRSFEYKLLNTLIQGSAADQTKLAMLAYHDDPHRAGRLILTVHDELVVVAPRAAAREEMRRLRVAMESVPLDVPLLSDGKLGTSWGAARPVKEER